MTVRFETGHNENSVYLKLVDDYKQTLWVGTFERFQAQSLIDLLRCYTPGCAVHAQSYKINVMQDGTSTVVMISADGNSYALLKVVLNAAQVLDLTSTLQMHIFASEQETRPKDIIPQLDDTLGAPPDQNSSWSLEKERDHYGLDNPHDEDDPADRWKKGK